MHGDADAEWKRQILHSVWKRINLRLVGPLRRRPVVVTVSSSLAWGLLKGGFWL